MNMFAKFGEIPAITYQDIKEIKRYGQTDTQTHMKTVYPPTNTVRGGIKRLNNSQPTHLENYKLGDSKQILVTIL